VPLIVLAQDSKQFTLKPGGSLRDISPTVLGMLGIPQPKEMTGHDLRTPAV
jgi:2,3-bisphosphoglycerate-independent phosphoglycerate mutase